MDSIDLTGRPPRAPRAELAGVMFLPRSIDKVCAMLPGGSIGEYIFEGHSANMLKRLGIEYQAFADAVRDAKSEDAVGEFVTAHTTPEKIAEWNGFISTLLPKNGDRAAALAAYPWLLDRTDLIYSVDVLEEDDRQSFAGRK